MSDEKSQREPFFGDEPLCYVELRSSDLLPLGECAYAALRIIRALSRSKYCGSAEGTADELAEKLDCSATDIVRMSKAKPTFAIGVTTEDNGATYKACSAAARSACKRFKNWVRANSRAFEKLSGKEISFDEAYAAVTEASAKNLAAKSRRLLARAKAYADSAKNARESIPGAKENDSRGN